MLSCSKIKHTGLVTSPELLDHLLKSSGFQIEQCYAGISEEAMDALPAPAMMSPRQILGHLTECCIACQEKVAGKEHAWGSYTPPTATSELLDAYRVEREKAVGALDGSAESVDAAADFLVAHEYYHVGQLCTARLTADSGWNAYSIYGM
jgi:hypothetical protein